MADTIPVADTIPLQWLTPYQPNDSYKCSAQKAIFIANTSVLVSTQAPDLPGMNTSMHVPSSIAANTNDAYPLPEQTRGQKGADGQPTWYDDNHTTCSTLLGMAQNPHYEGRGWAKPVIILPPVNCKCVDWLCIRACILLGNCIVIACKPDYRKRPKLPIQPIEHSWHQLPIVIVNNSTTIVFSSRGAHSGSNLN